MDKLDFLKRARFTPFVSGALLGTAQSMKGFVLFMCICAC